MSMVNSRLSLVTKSTQEFATAQKELFSIAQDSRTEFKSTIDLYSQMARSTESLGVSQDRLLVATESISKAITISGVSAQTAQASLVQLGQGLASGALQGDELRSILEGTPRLAQAIAEGMGVTIGELRKLGSEGVITAERVISALESQASALNQEFQGIAVNAQSGFLTLENSVTKTIGLLDEQYKITENIGTVFVALGTAFEDTFSKLDIGLEESTDKVGDFGLIVLDVTMEVVEGMGTLYDVLEAVGDVFSGVSAVARMAFYGIQTVSSEVSIGVYDTYQTLGNGIIGFFEQVTNEVKKSFQDSLNFIINGYNAIASRLGLGTVSTVKFEQSSFERIDKSGDIAELRKISSSSSEKFAEAQQDFINASRDLVEGGGGSELAENLNKSLAEAYAKLVDSKTSGGARATGGNVNNPLIDTPFNIDELTKAQEEYTKQRIEEFYGTSEAVKDTTEAMDDFIDTVFNDDDSVYETVNNITDSFNDFSTSANNADFGMNKVTDSLDRFIFKFENVLFNSIENNISKLNSVGRDTAFTSVTYSQALEQAISARNDLINNPLDVGIGEIYTTAYQQFVSSATDFISDPSQFGSAEEFAFARSTVGLQAEQFRGTADTTVSVLDSMNNFLGTINQAFADGILSDEEKATIAGVATEVNAKNDLLLGNSSSNTIKTSVEKLMGSGTDGISLTSISSGLPDLQVATGLESPISTLSTTTQGTTNAVNATSIKGSTAKTLDNIRLRSESTYTTSEIDALGIRRDFTNTEYDYYAKGGFTGSGMGQRDSSGFKQAGIVHEGEYVLPKWMVDAQPSMVSALESIRRKGTFAMGGYITPSSVTNVTNNTSFSQDNLIMNLTREVVDLKMTLRNAMNGDSLNVVLAG